MDRNLDSAVYAGCGNFFGCFFYTLFTIVLEELGMDTRSLLTLIFGMSIFFPLVVLECYRSKVKPFTFSLAAFFYSPIALFCTFYLVVLFSKRDFIPIEDLILGSIVLSSIAAAAVWGVVYGYWRTMPFVHEAP